MAVYVFSLLVGYSPNGVDNAQGVRNRYLKKLNTDIKYIFSDTVSWEYINSYVNLGIDSKDMLSPHLFFTDHPCVSGLTDYKNVLDEIMSEYENSEYSKDETGINVYNGNTRIARINLKEDKESVLSVYYYNHERLICEDIYSDRILYTNFYVTAKDSEGYAYAKLARRTYKNTNGSVAFETYFEGDREHFIFPDGRKLTKSEFFAEFIKKLNLGDGDIVLLDRLYTLEYVQPLFEYGSRAKFVAFLHSGHFFKKNENPNIQGVNIEYLYLFKNIDKINTIIVSTDAQREDLIKDLKYYGRNIPRIEVIPVCGVEDLIRPEIGRKKGSILSVSRLSQRKQVDIITKAVISAHKINDTVSLDIYGTGPEGYVSELKEIIKSNNAETYIRMMGQKDVRNVYKNYELFISASVFESFGLSLMEAAASGNAIIGLDARYGSSIFVKDGYNGVLIPFDSERDENEEAEGELICRMTEAVLKVFENRDDLERYQNNSYEIASEFLEDRIELSWIEFFNSIL